LSERLTEENAMITTNSLNLAQLSSRNLVSPLQVVAKRVAAAWAMANLWHERSRQRRQLMALDDRMLSDIGVSRAEADEEGQKRFWQP
jgi:uncharacterized protein YjiS (DUF1127 family)